MRPVFVAPELRHAMFMERVCLGLRREWTSFVRKGRVNIVARRNKIKRSLRLRWRGGGAAVEGVLEVNEA